MLYQSVRESAVHFKKRQKAKESLQQKIVFRWKFVVLGLGVILLVLVGICSELIKQISQLKKVQINTTFLYSLLPQSQFLSASISSIGSLIHNLNQTQGIKFDYSKLLYAGKQSSSKQIVQKIKQHGDLLVFIQLTDFSVPIVAHSFGLYLHPYLPQIDTSKADASLNVSDHRDQLYSMLFSLQNYNNLQISSTDSCFIYQYLHQRLSLLQLIHFDTKQISNKVEIGINNYGCFTSNNNTESAIQKVSKIIGFQLNNNQTNNFNLERIQIFALQMNYVDFEKEKSQSTFMEKIKIKIDKLQRE